MTERLIYILASEWVVLGGLMVVLALAASWWLRAVPIGQGSRDEADPGAPTPTRRDRLSFTAVAGLLAVVVAACLAVRVSLLPALAAFAIGFGLLIWAGRSARSHRHASPSCRRIAWFADSALNGALLAGVLIVGNLIAFRYGGRPIDMSNDGSNRLQSLTARRIQKLDQPARFVVFFGASERAAGQLERVRQLLRLFKAENPRHVAVEYLDPFIDPKRAEELAERVPGLTVTQGGGVLVEYGTGESTRRTLVRNSDMFAARADATGEPGRLRTDFAGESALLSALSGLVRDERPLVAITTGHGEPAISSMDPAGRGLGLLRQRLEAVGLRVVAYNPAKAVPDGVSLIIVAAPETPMGAEDVGRLRAESERGGPLLVLLDHDHPTGLEEWLESLGVKVGEGLVLDPTLAFRRPEFLLAQIDPGAEAHPIAAPLAGRTALLPHASPLELKLGARSPLGLFVAPVLRSGVRSWAERSPRPPFEFDPKVDAPGPIAVGASVSERPGPDAPTKEPRPRIVVFSSRTLADNTTVATPSANLDLVVNAVGWLQRRDDLSGAAPATYVARTLEAGPNLRVKLVVLPTLLAVSILLGLGIAAYLSRRE